jgi:pilus assembly protein Flp/PilA
MNALKNFVQDESGASAVEYGLLVALIAVVIIGAVTALGTSISNVFSTVSSKVDQANSVATAS